MQSFPRSLRLWTALTMLTWFGALEAAPALAGLAPSRVTGATAIASSRDADLIVVQRTLEHELVAQKLRDYGVSPDEIQARLATMSDQDLHQLATASAGLPTGADGLGVLVTVLVIVLLVVVILKLMNREVVVR